MKRQGSDLNTKGGNFLSFFFFIFCFSRFFLLHYLVFTVRLEGSFSSPLLVFFSLSSDRPERIILVWHAAFHQYLSLCPFLASRLHHNSSISPLPSSLVHARHFPFLLLTNPHSFVSPSHSLCLHLPHTPRRTSFRHRNTLVYIRLTSTPQSTSSC